MKLLKLTTFLGLVFSSEEDVKASSTGIFDPFGSILQSFQPQTGQTPCRQNMEKEIDALKKWAADVKEMNDRQYSNTPLKE